MTDWPIEHDMLLRDGFNKGWSYTQIARWINRERGTAYSKNACIGRARRLGLGVRSKPKPEPEPRSRTPRQRPDIAIRKAATPKKVVAPYVPKPDPMRPGHVRLIQLREGMCRWPNGEGAEHIRFCGLKQVEGESYCAEHCRAAYRAYAA